MTWASWNSSRSFEFPVTALVREPQPVCERMEIPGSPNLRMKRRKIDLKLKQNKSPVLDALKSNPVASVKYRAEMAPTAFLLPCPLTPGGGRRAVSHSCTS
jgi:hypothetical protein